MVTANLRRGAKGRGPVLAQPSHLLSSHLVCSCEMAAAAFETHWPAKCVNGARKPSEPIVCTHGHTMCTPPARLEQWWINHSPDQLNFFVFLGLGVIPNVSLHPKFCLLWGRENQYQSDARFLCSDWEFLVSRSSSGYGEPRAVYYWWQ